MERNRSWNLCIERKWADAWIGAYWKRTGGCIDVWICIVPFFPIHWSYWGRRVWWTAKDENGKRAVQ